MNITKLFSQAITLNATEEELNSHEVLQQKLETAEKANMVSTCLHGSSIKTCFREPRFYWISEFTVKCVLPVSLAFPEEFAEGFAKKGICSSFSREDGLYHAKHDIVVSAFATCSEDDREYFEVEIGEKVALNKAKINLHRQMINTAIGIIRDMHQSIAKLASFVEKEANLAQRNDKYIAKIQPSGKGEDKRETCCEESCDGMKRCECETHECETHHGCSCEGNCEGKESCE